MQTLTAYLTVADAVAAIDFYVEVLGAVEQTRWTGDDGRIGHAEIRFGDTNLYLADESPEVGALSPRTLGGNSTALVILVDDCDAVIESAVARGCTLDRPIADAPHGVRAGWVTDPFGYRWNIGTQIESPSTQEVAERVSDYTVTDAGDRPE